MKEFFKVKNLDEVLANTAGFPFVETETVSTNDICGRVCAEDIVAPENLPEFSRSTMDGYAVRADSTFGASEANPAYVDVKGTVTMGAAPDFTLGPGEAAKISTGGMLPEGSDTVVPVEYSDVLDEESIEIHKSSAPGQYVIQSGEDYKRGDVIIAGGCRIRAQEAGLLAAFGITGASVFARPEVAIISTGDEVVGINEKPGAGRIRDVNTHTLAGLVERAGCVPKCLGIVGDDYNDLFNAVSQAVATHHMVILSGGSSVGTRDYTIEVISSLPDSRILCHGISISPGKPTVLGKVSGRAVWGLPGHIVSAMVVFQMVVTPFLTRISGLSDCLPRPGPVAKLCRNLASAQGRVDFARVRLKRDGDELFAEPVLGKSGLINTMVKSDGLVMIERDTEGLDCGAAVEVILTG